MVICRIPHGMRGLKFRVPKPVDYVGCSRIPHGMRGLKFRVPKPVDYVGCSRIPHGMRGLKFLILSICILLLSSHPAWDAWIEIVSLSKL